MVGLEISEIWLQNLEGTSPYVYDLLLSWDQEYVTGKTQSGSFPKCCLQESAFCSEEGRSARRLGCYTSTRASTCKCSCLTCIPSWHCWSKLCMLTCTCHFLLLTTKRWWIWCAHSLQWSPCTEIGFKFRVILELVDDYFYQCDCQYPCRCIQRLKIHGRSANVSKVEIPVMGRVVWHVLDLQLLVLKFNKHVVAHAHEGVAVYQL